MEENKTIFKTPNDMTVKVSKFNGEVVLEEECCTCVSIILKNSGDMATSFLGSHNPQLVKVLEKTLKQYFKSIKKELKKEYKNTEEEIKVVSEDIAEENKWNGQPVPDVEVEEAKALQQRLSPKNGQKPRQPKPIKKNDSEDKKGSAKEQPAQKKTTTKTNTKKTQTTTSAKKPKSLK